MKYLQILLFWIFFISYTCYMFFKMSISRLKTMSLSPLEQTNAVHNIASEWGRGIIKIVPGWDFKLRGMEYTDGIDKKPVVFVANHQSSTDILALFCTDLPFRWLSKNSIFKIPIIGHAMRWAGYVPIHRGDKSSHRQALSTSASWLNQGVPMVFFPEGSRSKTGTLRPFKTGAFRLAVENDLAVQPIVIHGTKQMMEKHSMIPNKATVTIELLKESKKKTDETMEEFAERIRCLIAERHAHIAAESH